MFTKASTETIPLSTNKMSTETDKYFMMKNWTSEHLEDDADEVEEEDEEVYQGPV